MDMAARQKPINLALQGGGAHGAYTWGVLDTLLDDGRLDFAAISGTSAGAINAVVMAEGYAEGGRDGARKQLEQFWKGISESAQFSPVRRTWVDRTFGLWSIDHSPGLWWIDAMSRIASPYDLNPFNLNPITTLLEKMIDFEKVRHCKNVRLFISATNVHSGKVRVFENAELSAQHIMASACLPGYFQAVEIDGVPYWDGGYMGNPSLFPFFYHDTPDDVLLVQVNPVERKQTPKTAQEIRNRVDEISFNSALLNELRSIAFVQKLIDEERLDNRSYRRIRMHRIHDDDMLNPFNAATKMNAEWDFLTHLRDLGRQSAHAFLKKHYRDIGERETMDIHAELS